MKLIKADDIRNYLIDKGHEAIDKHIKYDPVDFTVDTVRFIDNLPDQSQGQTCLNNNWQCDYTECLEEHNAKCCMLCKEGCAYPCPRSGRRPNEYE